MRFPTDMESILDRVEKIEPEMYARSRNYIDGAVTGLSPYISRGVISTKYVLDSLIARGYEPLKIEKFVQELAWRDYWQQIWITKSDALDNYLKHPQAGVIHHEIPTAIISANTKIEAIDNAISEFYETGYLHNHVRMYIAAITCNIGKSHWKLPAQWMYYQLLDADWASNALSWQWVAGTNSNKKYYANQENINRYCHTDQHETFLDVSYEAFDEIKVPSELGETIIPRLETTLPQKKDINVDKELPTLIFNFYNLDPNWRKDLQANHILLLEPSHFAKYPISDNTIEFVLNLGMNIPKLQVYIGEFHELIKTYGLKNIYFKEHPLNQHYQGNEDARDWMFGVQGYYPSFFSFWRKCKKELKS